MKKLILLVSVLYFLPFFLSAQTMNFQGIARNNSGSPLASITIKVRLSIRSALSGGTVLYREVKSVQTNAFGLYQITINDGTGTVTGNFSAINWAAGGRFLQTEIDPANGNSFINMGTTSLHSVPYALHTRQADKWAEGKAVVQNGTISDSVLPVVGQGNRLIWHPKKAAFRVGYSMNNNWEDSATGIYSFATGFITKAKGVASTAFGNGTTATGNYSFVAGSDNTAQNTYSIALGMNSQALGYGSITLGTYLTAKGTGSIAVGNYNDDTDDRNSNRLFQIGAGWLNLSNNTGQRRNAMTVLRNGNIGIGSNVLSPVYVLDVGGRMRIKNNGSTAGVWLNNSINNEYAFIGGRDNFSVGVYFKTTGTWKFHVNQYGDAWFAGRVTQSSDSRLKKDIRPALNSLQRLNQLSAYNFLWKDSDRNPEQQTGLLAQEVERVFPELVGRDEKGFLTVDYTGLVPHLLEAIKSLQNEIEILKKGK